MVEPDVIAGDPELHALFVEAADGGHAAPTRSCSAGLERQVRRRPERDAAPQAGPPGRAGDPAERDRDPHRRHRQLPGVAALHRDAGHRARRRRDPRAGRRVPARSCSARCPNVFGDFEIGRWTTAPRSPRARSSRRGRPRRAAPGAGRSLRLDCVSLARAERAALSDTLDRTDPTNPPSAPAGPPATCWRTCSSASGSRGRRAASYPVPRAGHRARDAAATRHAVERTWSSSCGPGRPAWSPSRIGRVDEAVNGAELFVHHEDVRRGRPGWEPRGADETRDGALWDTGHADGQAAVPAQPGRRGGAPPDGRAGRDQDGPRARSRSRASRGRSCCTRPAATPRGVELLRSASAVERAARHVAAVRARGRRRSDVCSRDAQDVRGSGRDDRRGRAVPSRA